jgi:hypothetical protein
MRAQGNYLSFQTVQGLLVKQCKSTSKKKSLSLLYFSPKITFEPANFFIERSSHVCILLKLLSRKIYKGSKICSVDR